MVVGDESGWRQGIITPLSPSQWGAAGGGSTSLAYRVEGDK